jgi:hypothetical protein
MSGVVHVICASLRPDAPAEAVAQAMERARGLAEAPGVLRTFAARADDAILTATWVANRAALEVFAASPPHMAFVMRGLAPCIRGMWSAAAETEAALPSTAAALWVFAIRDAEAVFEWQVRDLLAGLDSLPGHLAAGATFEERDRYRAGGVVAVPAGDVEAFTAALSAARQAWGDLAEHVVDVFAPVSAS